MHTGPITAMRPQQEVRVVHTAYRGSRPLVMTLKVRFAAGRRVYSLITQGQAPFERREREMTE